MKNTPPSHQCSPVSIPRIFGAHVSCSLAPLPNTTGLAFAHVSSTLTNRHAKNTTCQRQHHTHHRRMPQEYYVSTLAPHLPLWLASCRLALSATCSFASASAIVRYKRCILQSIMWPLRLVLTRHSYAAVSASPPPPIVEVEGKLVG